MIRTRAGAHDIFWQRGRSCLGGWAILLALGGALFFPLFHCGVATAADEAPAADELSDEEAAPGAAGADKPVDLPNDSAPPKQRTLLDTIKDGGVIGFLILLLSMVAVGFVVEHFISIRKPALMPEMVLADLEQMIAQGQIDKAIEYCHQPETYSMASAVILAGLERYKGAQFGFAEYKSAVEEEGEDQTARLYRKTEVLGLIGAIAPMLGLMGTVLGMITAFNTIAAKGGMARPDELAGGIGQALVTTLMGLIVAIPTMIAFSYFRNRIDSIVSEAGKRIERVMMPLGRQRTK